MLYFDSSRIIQSQGYTPDIDKTSPTSWDEKLKPPYCLPLTAQREKIYKTIINVTNYRLSTQSMATIYSVDWSML